MAGKRAGRDPAKEQYWRQMVRRWEDSGLSVRHFCNRFALLEHSFYAWRRVLTQRDHEAGASAVRPGASGRVETPPEMPRFVPVRVIADAPAGSPPAPGIEVVLASGTLIRVPRGVDRQTLADVIAALEQRTC